MNNDNDNLNSPVIEALAMYFRREGYFTAQGSSDNYSACGCGECLQKLGLAHAS